MAARWLAPRRGEVDVVDRVQPFALTASAGFRHWLVTAPARRGVLKIKRFREWLLRQVATGKPDDVT